MNLGSEIVYIEPKKPTGTVTNMGHIIDRTSEEIN